MPHSRTMTFLLVLLMTTIQIGDLVVELGAFLAAVVLEAHHRTDAACSRKCQRHEEEDSAAIAFFLVHLVVEGHGYA